MTAGVRRVRGAAVALPAAGEPGPGPEAHVVREVARRLGNTEVVARESYIDPRVFRLYKRGVTVADALPDLGSEARTGEPATQGGVEEAVLRMLDEHG